MNQRFRQVLLFVAGIMLCGSLQAHQEVDSPVRFIENKGQWEPQIRFTAELPNGKVFFEEDRLTFNFCDLSDLHDRWFYRKPNESETFPLDCHAFTLHFPNANPGVSISGAKREKEYHNYILGQDPSKWASEVGIFQEIHYKELFPGIEFIVYAHEDGLKYDFVLAPNADPSLVRMVYEGLEGMLIFDGQLHLNTSLNKIIDDVPVAFQEGVSVPCHYELDGNEVRFQFPEGYDRERSLTIDPTLVFSTFTGSTANNFGFTATYDDFGNLFAGGIAYSIGYPVTTGAYQTTFGGGFDISISKFDANGVHLWSTYIGGGSSDQPHSMIAEPAGDLYIYGRSASNDFPVTPGAYDTSHNGAYDIILCRLSGNGATLQTSTYIGGSDNDGLNITNAYTQQSIKFNYGDDARGEVVLDDEGNVYVASCTRSGNFPTTPGALDGSLSGSQDGCVMKLPDGLNVLNYSTYLGGSDDDAAYSLKVDAAGQAFVTGGTRSNDFPTSTGSISPNPPGGIDGFITHLNGNGTGFIASTYIGTTQYNQCYFLELDRDEDVYVVGQKIGSWPIIPQSIWRTPNGGGQFILKADNALANIVYSTEFGTTNTTPNFSPTAFLVDVCEYVYVSGWGGFTNFNGTTTGLPTTFDAIQSTTDGSDLYMIVLEPDITGLDFATFIGGTVSNEHVDGGTSRFNKRAEIYQSVCAGCQGNSDFPTTSNAHSSTNNSTGCNLACFKLQLNLPGVVADFEPDPDTAGCAPHFVQFDNLSAGGNQFFWDFGDGSPIATTFNTSHLFQNPGTYTVTLVVVDSMSCNISDTARRVIEVFPYPVASITPDTNVCEGESISLTAGGGMNYNWSPPVFLSGTSGPTVQASPASPITYTVVVTNPGGCADTATVNLGVLPKPVATALGDTLICPGDSVGLQASGGSSFLWSPSTGLSDPNIASPLASPTGPTSYVVTVTAANGCTDEDTVDIDVSAVQADAGPDIDLCIGDSTLLAGAGGGTYAWFPPTNLSSVQIASPIADPSSDITYYLTVTDVYGCQHTDSVEVLVHPLPNIVAGPDDQICDNDSIQLNASGGNTYAWTPSNLLTNANTANPVASPTTPTTFVVIGTDQFGCRNRDSTFIDVIPAPTAVALGDATICQDSSTQLYASGGISYSWSPGAPLSDPNSQNPIATLVQTTQFVVTVFAANGCNDRDTVLVEVTPTPVLDISGRDIICLDQNTGLIASGAESYVWNTGETTAAISVSPNATTWYSVVGYVEGCPSPPDSFLLTVDDALPLAQFEASPDSGWIPLTTTFFNQSQGASSFQWDLGDGTTTTVPSPQHTYTDTGRFEIQLIAYNENNCPDTAYQRVIVGADFSIYVPNAFTPNGDGHNDYFETPWFGVREYHILIFDRWGMLIYESFDPDFNWYGIFKGKDVQEGVYTYVIEARGYIGESVKKAGTVTLYR